MIFNKNKKHLHFEMPKTASGTIHRNSAKVGYERLNMHTGINHLKNKRPDVYKEIMVKDNWLVSCIIRNPWDHAVSYYYHALDKNRFFKENFFRIPNLYHKNIEDIKKEDLSFKAFLNKGYIPRRQQITALGLFDPHNNIINRFVNYNDKIELRRFLSEFGVDENSVSLHRRQAISTVIDIDKHKDYRMYYDDETFDIIRVHCRREIQFFDYQF